MLAYGMGRWEGSQKRIMIPGFQVLDSGFLVSGKKIPDPRVQDSGYNKKKFSDSGIHKQDFPDSIIPDYLTWVMG